MKILLIHPPNSKASIAPGRFEPLALEVLAALVPDHDVSILDLRIDTYRVLDDQIASFHPVIAGITVNNSIHVIQAKKLISYIHNRYPEMIQVVGGHHATMLPVDFRVPGIHAIFLGWAEKSFPAYIESFENGKPFDQIQGVEILDHGKVLFHNDNRYDLKASDIPYPRRDLVARYLKKYHSDMGFRTSLVNTTRGCANRCSFCSVWQAAGGRIIIRSAEDVFNEIASLPKFIPRVFFADDNTFLNPENALRLCRLIKEANIRKKYSGYCRSDTITRHPDMMREWREIGLDNLCVGFETTSDDQLNDLNKKNTLTNNEEAARILNDIGIPFRPHFLVDPGFKKEDFSRVIHYVTKNNLKSPIFPILTPIPGTKYHSEVKKNIILSYDYFDFAHAVVTTRLSPRGFYTEWIQLYFSSYPIRKNLKRFLLRNLARMTGNKDGVKMNSHIRLINLFLLRFVGIFLYLKLVRHYHYLEKNKQ
ncbi:MAG TPA: radical SAM protein [Bacteroidales bacterium]|nr:radical SAM protein [Bacteroidales bacterium]